MISACPAREFGLRIADCKGQRAESKELREEIRGGGVERKARSVRRKERSREEGETE